MLVIQCKTCRDDFKTYPCLVEAGKGKFCSPKCSQVIPKFSIHGMCKTRLYRIWMNMRRRCSDPKHTKFNEYGGRGITVCDEWNLSFQIFKDWAEANGYAEELEIDRRLGDQGYSAGNCRWATRSQQMSNSRKRKNAVTSQYRGVCWSKQAGKWKSRIQINGRVKHLGFFADPVVAAKAYDTAAKELFKEFAFQNFTEEVPC